MARAQMDADELTHAHKVMLGGLCHDGDEGRLLPRSSVKWSFVAVLSRRSLVLSKLFIVSLFVDESAMNVRLSTLCAFAVSAMN